MWFQLCNDFQKIKNDKNQIIINDQKIKNDKNQIIINDQKIKNEVDYLKYLENIFYFFD